MVIAELVCRGIVRAAACMALVVVILAVSMKFAGAGDAYCGPDGVKFAHCPGAERNFHSVVLAIHGWRGKCSTTFGKDKSSLFTLLDDGRFFDWDCFDYDSDTRTIAENVALLKGRLEALRRDGYQEVLLVTHSTGGILALHTLADRYVQPNGDRLPAQMLSPTAIRDQIRIPAIVAWATPINGLDWQISTGAGVINFFNVSKAILPDLDAESDYLKSLRQRLRGVGQLYANADADLRRAMSTKVFFYQGQGNDWVVRSIVRDAAIKEGWLWAPERGRLTATNLGHTSNVGDAGTESAHGFPADINDFISFLNVHVRPAFDNVFPTRYDAIPASFDARQKLVIHGIKHYASWNFPYAIDSSVIFMKRMLLETFPRSNERDMDLVDAFLNEIEIQAGKPDHQNLISSLVKFAREVLGSYDGRGGADTRRAGHNSNAYVLKVLQLSQKIDGFLRDAEPEQIAAAAANASGPNLPATMEEAHRREAVAQSMNAAFGSPIADEASISRGIEEARTSLVKSIAKLLDSDHAPVQSAALATLSSTAGTLSDESVRQANLVDAVADYYRTKTNDLKSSSKKLVGDMLLELARRESDVGAVAWSILSEDVSFQSKDVPMWLSIQNPEFTEKLVAEQRKASANVVEQMGTKNGDALAGSLVKVSTDIARFVGDDGRNTSVARDAFAARRELLQTLPARARSELDAKNPVTGGELAKWPGLRREFAAK